jgi:hypothetical protein
VLGIRILSDQYFRSGSKHIFSAGILKINIFLFNMYYTLAFQPTLQSTSNLLCYRYLKQLFCFIF